MDRSAISANITNMSNERDSGEQKENQLALLTELKASHRHLDMEIAALREMGAVDMLKIGRMKKFKLKLKDQITVLENKLTPDIIA